MKRNNFSNENEKLYIQYMYSNLNIMIIMCKIGMLLVM